MTDISKRLYQKLSPKQRAVACFAALNRGDSPETGRLLGSVPTSGGHSKAIFAIRQAQNTYNYFISKVRIDLLHVVSRSIAARSFCLGFAVAGGTIDHKEYLKNCAIAEQLTPLIDGIEAQLNAIRLAGFEWCETNSIPTDIFSGMLCHFPPQKSDEHPVCNETLEIMRSLFKEITLTW
ncbi:MAG: hypothetical protein A2511_01395 [Deltaproteobacteria bacterium RIFOXYD12_FULL_50_9]|nr:MAG: hypothetical protein A2511_01395 [Deltaproteobacteria bacterium RIFOXYD12_FULL_50_9]